MCVCFSAQSWGRVAFAQRKRAARPEHISPPRQLKRTLFLRLHLASPYGAVGRMYSQVCAKPSQNGYALKHQCTCDSCRLVHSISRCESVFVVSLALHTARLYHASACGIKRLNLQRQYNPFKYIFDQSSFGWGVASSAGSEYDWMCVRAARPRVPRLIPKCERA